MATTAQATAAPREIELAGNKYRLTPLKDREFGEFEAWVQDRYVRIAKRNLEGLEGEDRRTLLQSAFEKASRITMNSPEALQLMVSREGLSKLMWLGLRHEQPDITEEQVRDLLADQKSIEAALDAHDEINGVKKAKAAKKKPVKRRKTKSR